MLYLSSLLPTRFPACAARIFAALDANGIAYQLLPDARDIWLRDFMPICTGSGRLISFRYEPGYLVGYEHLRTGFRRDMAHCFKSGIIYSGINLDGGNVVFSPSRRRAIISDRVFSENPDYEHDSLLYELEKLLEAEVIIIPSLKSDMTGHADGMVCFPDEQTVLCNRPLSSYGFENRVRRALIRHGIEAVDFPFCPGTGAIGCYINYLETDTCVFLPVFGIDADEDAVGKAQRLFGKKTVPIPVREIAAEGGALRCITWEM